MKISKIFHSLYACLLFLPSVFFLSTCTYYTFNENASLTSVSYSNYIDLPYQNLIKNGNFTSTNFWSPFSHSVSTNFTVDSNVLSITGVGVSQTISVSNIGGHVFYCSLSLKNIDTTICQYQVTGRSGPFSTSSTTWSRCESLYTIPTDSTDNYILFRINAGDTSSFGHTFCAKDAMLFDLTSIFGVGNEPTTIESVRNYFPFDYYETGHIQALLGNYSTNSFTGNLYKNFIDIWDNPLFSWSKSNFTIVGMNYICNLFGFSNNGIIYYLNYVLCISIVWLLFDVAMYVPNLCHRLLDRGAIK